MAIALRIGMLVCLLSVHCIAAEPATRPFDAANPDFFPIMGWNAAPNDPAVLKKMKECGLTVAGFAPPEALDACQAVGLKAIVSDARTSGYDWHSVDAAAAKAKVTELLKQTRNHPAVFGYYLRDEPSADLFGGLATLTAIIKEQHPGVWPYVNLFPNYATPGQLGTPTYEAYLEKYIETCKPTVLSYDHYALHEGGGFGDVNYFANLDAMRKVALKHKLPFWNIVQAQGCLNFRVPSETDFRFQLYTSVAYGVKGIAYFQYIGAAVGNFRSAPIDPFGNETATWKAMQGPNLQIGKLGPTILKLHSDAVYHFGKLPQGAAGPAETSLVKAVGGSILVGDFTHEDGSRYVLCVNKDFNGSVPCFPQFRDAVKKLEMVSPYSGQLTGYEGEQCWLAPGQGVLLKVTLAK